MVLWFLFQLQHVTYSTYYSATILLCVRKLANEDKSS